MVSDADLFSRKELELNSNWNSQNCRQNDGVKRNERESQSHIARNIINSFEFMQRTSKSQHIVQAMPLH